MCYGVHQIRGGTYKSIENNCIYLIENVSALLCSLRFVLQSRFHHGRFLTQKSTKQERNERRRRGRRKKHSARDLAWSAAPSSTSLACFAFSFSPKDPNRDENQWMSKKATEPSEKLRTDGRDHLARALIQNQTKQRHRHRVY